MGVSQTREIHDRHPEQSDVGLKRFPALLAYAPDEHGLAQCTSLTRMLQTKCDGYGGAPTLHAFVEALAGEDLDAQDGHGVAPLHAAIFHDQPLEVIQCLLDRGAAADALDGHGRRPVDAALFRSRNEVLKPLREAGADLRRRFEAGRTYGHRAILHGGSVTGLKAVGVALDAPDEHGWWPVHLAALSWAAAAESVVRSRLDLEVLTPRGDTPLILCARRALSRRIVHWHSEGTTGGDDASYTIDWGVMTYRRKGKVRKISPGDERIMARRLGAAAHAQYLNSVAVVARLAAKADLSSADAAGVPAIQWLADLRREELAKIAKKRGVAMPAPRPGAPVSRPELPPETEGFLRWLHSEL